MGMIFDGHWGGLSDSKYSGIVGSFAKLIGIDGNSVPGILRVHQALTKESSTTVTAFTKIAITVSSGESFWFSSTDGKIWRRSTGGTWLLVHTTVPAAGTAGCSGAMEFDAFIYWATQRRLHRIPIASIATAQNWTDNKELDWATFTNADPDFHPMQIQTQKLFIGDADFVSEVEDVSGTHTFTAKALDIKKPLRVKTMIDFDIDLLLGTFIADEVNSAQTVRWDTSSTSWETSDPIDEAGINAFLRDDNFVYAQAGKFGKWFLYDGAQLVPAKRIPGDYSPSKTAVVHPQSVATYLGVPRFGLSNYAGNPTEQGVYTLGSYSKDYPKVLDLSFVISEDITSSIEIGAILAIGGDLLVSWKNSTTYGVDLLSYTAKYGSAAIETMILTHAEARSFLKTVDQFIANYVKLPASTAIVFKYKKLHEASYSSAMTVIDDTTLFQVRTELGSIPDVASLQVRIEFTVSGNNAPEIETLEFTDNISDQAR